MLNNDIIITDFKMLDILKITTMPLITVYFNPIDYPNKYIARLWDIDNPTKYVVVSDNLEGVRHGIPSFMAMIPPSFNDDKVIVETWI